MGAKVYYIKGSEENPEGVKQALLDVCPDAKNIDDFGFAQKNYYYYAIDGAIDYAYDFSHILLLKHVGEELQPNKTEKVEFVEQVMYQRIYLNFGTAYVYEDDILYKTIEEATNSKDAVGYSEIKIMMKKTNHEQQNNKIPCQNREQTKDCGCY